MKVILLQDVAKVGRKGSIANVADGFAINSLLPQKKAIIATPDAIKKHEAAMKDKQALDAAHVEKVKKLLAGINGSTVTLEERANDKGHLFAQVQSFELVAALKAQLNVEIDPSWIESHAPIRETGETKLKLSYGGGKAMVTVSVQAKK
jgi:large subunit ribosomal protein L9